MLHCPSAAQLINAEKQNEVSRLSPVFSEMRHQDFCQSILIFRQLTVGDRFSFCVTIWVPVTVAQNLLILFYVSMIIAYWNWPEFQHRELMALDIDC